jgi:2,3-diketo-5-methylthio-1-phosphopentane phosphatase
MVELPGSYPFADGLRAVLFCDFDGTLTPTDIGTALLRHYSSAATEAEELLRSGKISVLEYYQRTCSALSPEATPDSIAAFACRIGLSPYAQELIAFCRGQGIGVAIVSDGLDAYILPVLEQAGLAELPIACNRLRWEGESPVVEFPWAYESCQRSCPSPYPCAACKRAVLLSWAPPGATILYLGEGASDFCPAFYADFVFARGELAQWCQEHGIGFIAYRSLFEVRQALEQLLRQRRLRPRLLPSQRRQRAWVEE